MIHHKILSACLTAVVSLALMSCRHKPLYVAPQGGDSMEIVFDWLYAPDANPTSVAAYLFPTDDNPQAVGGLRYVFAGRDGGTVRIPYGDYIAVGMNADNNDWVVLSNSGDPDNIYLSTMDADLLEGRSIPTHMMPRYEAARQERVAKAPDMLWTDHVEGVRLTPSPAKKRVTLYPEERICRYYVDVLDVSNIEATDGGVVDATISGLAEGIMAGHDLASDTPVTMPLVLRGGVSPNTLHGMTYTFGDTPVSCNSHILTLYMILEDNTKWAYSFDVTDQVDNAPNPRNVHIVVRGLELPAPGKAPAGLMPDVNDWQAVYINLNM